MTIEGGRPSPLRLQALNEMIDNQAKHLAAVQNRVPNIVFLALYSVAIAAFVFVGYANGLQERGQRFPIYLMGAIVSAVILLVQDLHRPTAGFIAVSRQPMLDAIASIANYSE